MLTHGVGPVRKYSIGAAFSTSTIPRRCLPARANRCYGRSPPSAKATFPTSSIPVAPCATTTRSSCLTRSPTPTPILRRSVFRPYCGGCGIDRSARSRICRRASFTHGLQGSHDLRNNLTFLQVFNAGKGTYYRMWGTLASSGGPGTVVVADKGWARGFDTPRVRNQDDDGVRQSAPGSGFWSSA